MAHPDAVPTVYIDVCNLVGQLFIQLVVPWFTSNSGTIGVTITAYVFVCFARFAPVLNPRTICAGRVRARWELPFLLHGWQMVEQLYRSIIYDRATPIALSQKYFSFLHHLGHL